MSILPRGNLEVATSLCSKLRLPSRKAKILRVLEDDNLTGQKLVDKHRQPSLAEAHV